MNPSLLPKRKHRHVLDLQLTAMIDIFSLIVIFLIKGTVFGVSDLPIDPKLKLPSSQSKESLDTAPSVQLVGDQIRFSASADPSSIPLAELSAGGAGRSRLLSEIQSYLARLSPEAKGSGVLLSFIADRDAAYSDVFRVVRFFRESGFDSILFVASVEEGK